MYALHLEIRVCLCVDTGADYWQVLGGSFTLWTPKA